jgi:hypothetical protein
VPKIALGKYELNCQMIVFPPNGEFQTYQAKQCYMLSLMSKNTILLLL